MSNTMAVRSRSNYAEESYGEQDGSDRQEGAQQIQLKRVRRQSESWSRQESAFVALSLFFFLLISTAACVFVAASVHLAVQTRRITALNQALVAAKNRHGALVKEIASLTNEKNIASTVAALQMTPGSGAAYYVQVDPSNSDSAPRQMASAL